MTFRLLAAFVFGFFAISCSSPNSAAPASGGGGRGTRDALGHRAGPRGFRTVVLDAGHGGRDSGARSSITGDLEKSLTLDMVERLQRELGSQFNVIQMRRDDSFIDLDDRVSRANRSGDGILISVHFNSGPSHVAGPETFFWRVDSASLAKRLQRAMASVSPAQSTRGVVRRRLRLTRNPEIPSVLIECGYLSHGAEARRCADPSYRAALARALAQAVRDQSAYGDDGMGALPPPINAPMSRPTDARE
jgi:N-acetylmuramoyl-L-alanine amidase